MYAKVIHKQKPTVFSLTHQIDLQKYIIPVSASNPDLDWLRM